MTRKLRRQKLELMGVHFYNERVFDPKDNTLEGKNDYDVVIIVIPFVKNDNHEGLPFLWVCENNEEAENLAYDVVQAHIEETIRKDLHRLRELQAAGGNNSRISAYRLSDIDVRFHQEEMLIASASLNSSEFVTGIEYKVGGVLTTYHGQYKILEMSDMKKPVIEFKLRQFIVY